MKPLLPLLLLLLSCSCSSPPPRDIAPSPVLAHCAGPGAEHFAAFLRRMGVPAKGITVGGDLRGARDANLVYWRGNAPPAGLDDLSPHALVVIDAPLAAVPRTAATVFAAAAPGEPAIELEGTGRGLFSFLVEEGASGAADADRGGTVSLGELIAWLEREVAAQAGLDGIEQHPRAYREGRRMEASDPAAREPWLPVPPARR